MTTASTRLRAAGLRATRQRSDVLTAVDQRRHATPEQVYHVVADTGIDLSTVYRCLEALAAADLITHTHIGHGPPVYHALTSEPHLHLVCQVCGGQTSAAIDTAASLIHALQRRYGFHADLDYAAIPGLCENCRAAGESGQP